jgi:uncharacterized membrane protein HdeD (DUF308 family)
MPTIIEAANAAVPAISFGHRWRWLLVLGLVQLIAGGIAIAVPIVASLAAVAVLGAVLIVSAILQIAHAFKVRAWPRSAWYALGGLLYAIVGVLAVLYPFSGLLTLAVMIALLLIAEGSARIVFGTGVRPAPGWGWLVAAGISSIVVGVILLLGWPTTALWGVGLLLGINLIFTGAANVTLAVAASHPRHHAPA